MKKTAIVTGVAGFIGSNLAERLVQEYHVVGIDCFTDYYSKQIKMQNIKNLLSNRNFEFVETDLANYDLDVFKETLTFHQAAQPGVRSSWGYSFEEYVRNNIIATQRILEACARNPPRKLIFASSSSVYGDACEVPMTEEQTPRPVSPYGVTKLAAENLCYLYWKNFNVPTISLRYFTVYGPRQRPDMAIGRFVTKALKGKEILIYGDGSQSRDFTYISDIVEANVLAAKSEVEGEVFNIGSGKSVTINFLIDLIQDILRKEIKRKFCPSMKGDVRATCASTKKANKIFGFTPKVALADGLRLYIDWIMANRPDLIF
jgi:UDP-glucose 4-epimerase